MQSYNHVVMIGRLTRDPELKAVQEYQKASFTLAVDRSYAKDDGEKETDFFQVVSWGKLAEICQNYVKKGRLVLVEGRLQVRNYDKNGQKQYVTELIAEKLQMLDYPRKQNNAPSLMSEEPALKAA